MSPAEEQLTNRIVRHAVLPVVKVMLQDDPKMASKFEGVSGIVQFVAESDNGPAGAYLKFDNGELEVVQEIADNPDVVFHFSRVKKMNDMFRGKPVLPSFGPLLKGMFGNAGLLFKTFAVLLGLKILMPTAKPKTEQQAYLKVKMTLYMISTALSQLNKAGDPDIQAWTAKQPLRIYQWSVDGTDIACYLKIKAGKTKAGRGRYTRRRPFVHMIFRDLDAALPVLASEIDNVQAMAQGLLVNDGSPEYGGKVGDFMMRVGNMLQ